MILGRLSVVLYRRCRSYENKKHSEWSQASMPEVRKCMGLVSGGDIREPGVEATVSAYATVPHERSDTHARRLLSTRELPVAV
jgi:hypothetical protein